MQIRTIARGRPTIRLAVSLLDRLTKNVDLFHEGSRFEHSYHLPSTAILIPVNRIWKTALGFEASELEESTKVSHRVQIGNRGCESTCFAYPELQFVEPSPRINAMNYSGLEP